MSSPRRRGDDERTTVRLSDSLAAVVRDLRDEPPSGDGVAAVASMGGVFGRWEAAVGPAVAAHVQPVRLDGRA